jgi:hypothetical protein
MTRAWWKVALPAVAALAALTPLPPGLVERWYADRIYPVLQPAVTSTTNAVPFALLDVMVALAVAWLTWRAVARWRESGRSRVRRILRLLGDAIAGLAVAYLLFLVFWGLNYRRPGPESRFLVQRERVSNERLVRIADHATSTINHLHRAERATGTLEVTAVVRELRPAFLRAIEDLRMSWRPVGGRPKTSLIARLFPLAAVDGMMNPWALEILLNPEVLPFERPFLIAHEWAHLAGHAGESEASFVGWLACLRAGRDAQYSAWLGVYLHIVRTLPPDEQTVSLEQLEAGPRRDVDAIRERLMQARPSVQAASWRVYDRYLRANRVRSGIASYDEVVVLILGSRFSIGHLPPP